MRAANKRVDVDGESPAQAARFLLEAVGLSVPGQQGWRRGRFLVRLFELHSAVLIQRTPEEIFPFFADARNLDLLTPPWLHFQIVDPAPTCHPTRHGNRLPAPASGGSPAMAEPHHGLESPRSLCG